MGLVSGEHPCSNLILAFGSITIDTTTDILVIDLEALMWLVGFYPTHSNGL